LALLPSNRSAHPHSSTPSLHDALPILLVFIVVLVFLQNWRATIIPMIAVPVSLVGALAVMALLGFSLNNLSLFGLVLAIGIVVEDRKSTRLNSSHVSISYAVFCLKKKS